MIEEKKNTVNNDRYHYTLKQLTIMFHFLKLLIV